VFGFHFFSNQEDEDEYDYDEEELDDYEEEVGA